MLREFITFQEIYCKLEMLDERKFWGKSWDYLRFEGLGI